jgi:hypothetical protein
MNGIPFDYNGYASGDDFIGRSGDVTKVQSLIRQRKNIIISDIPASGKESLVREACSGLKRESPNFALCMVDMFNVRTSADFVLRFHNSIAEAFPSAGLLPADSCPENLADDGVEMMLSSAEKVCAAKGYTLIVCLKEFQNTALFEDADAFFERVESVWSHHHGAVYILTGSAVNSMKYIFEERKYLYDFAERVELSRIDDRAFDDYINSVFLKAGKVIEDDQRSMLCKVSDCHPGYLRMLAGICYNMTRGYVMEGMVEASVEDLIEICRPHFISLMGDITLNQINLVRAVLDGVQKFSGEDVIRKYHLNSSANVFRIKEALQKKEVVTFDSDDKARIMDPLLRYWLENYYFK